MIKGNLRTLSFFIEELSQRSDIDVFSDAIKWVKQYHELDKNTNQLRADLHDSIKMLIKHFKDIGLSDEAFIFEFFEICKSLIVRKMIFQKAYELGIDPLLYKKKMGFLYKGKPLD
jgi:hypothetical protein